MRKLLIVVLLSCSFTVVAGYTKDIMEPWMGATLKELTNAWGFPQSADDLFKVSETTTIYTYRSNRGGIGGQLKCAVSFTIRENKVVGFKYEGGHCPRIKRKK
jgi:hypothetical protein